MTETKRRPGRPKGSTGTRTHDPDEEIERLISRRAATTNADREVEELWKPSARRYNQRKEDRRRLEWYCFHLDQAERIERTACALAESHRAAAQALLEREVEETRP